MITLAIVEAPRALLDGISLFLKYEENISTADSANDGIELIGLVQKNNQN